MNYHDWEDVRQEIAMERLRGTVAGRAWISAYRRVVRSRRGIPRWRHQGLTGKEAFVAYPDRVAACREEIASLPWHLAVRGLRLLKGLGTAELARLAGVSEFTICGTEAGSRHPRATTRRRLLAALTRSQGTVRPPTT